MDLQLLSFVACTLAEGELSASQFGRAGGLPAGGRWKGGWVVPRVRLDTLEKWLINLLLIWRIEPQFLGWHCVGDFRERADIFSICINRCESCVLPHLSQVWVCNIRTHVSWTNESDIIRKFRTLADDRYYNAYEREAIMSSDCKWICRLMGVDRHNI